MRQRGRGAAWRLLRPWGSTMVGISGAEERVEERSFYQQFILYRMCSLANISNLREFGQFSLTTVASTGTCKHLTEDLHVFSVYSRASPLLLMRKGGQYYFSCMCSEQFLELQLSSHFPLPFPGSFPLGFDNTNLMLWVTPNNSSPLFLLKYAKELKVRFLGCFCMKNHGVNRDNTDLLGFQLWADLWCSEQGCAAFLQSPAIPVHSLCCWVPPPFWIPATFLRACTQYSKSWANCDPDLILEAVTLLAQPCACGKSREEPDPTGDPGDT